MSGAPIPESEHKIQRPERLNLSGVLLSSVESAVLVVDTQKRVTAFSGPAERFTGRSAEEVIGQPVAVLPAALKKIVQETFASGKPVADRTIVLFPEAEEKKPVRANTSLCRDASDRPVAVVAILHDFAASRKLEERIRRLERLASIGTFSAGVAHEIKNALVAIKSFVQLQSQGNRSAELNDLFKREVERIDSLTGQLLKFAGPAKPAFSVVRIHEVIENSLRLVQHKLKTRKIDLVRALDSGTDAVRGDAKQLEQVFINLLLNAIEAMDEMGTLTVATETVLRTNQLSQFEPKGKRQQIQISIRDTGSGIPPELMGSVFVPFVTTKPEGTGLGLAITARIIQEHRGTIKVESEVNKGTRFNITLPLLKA